MATNIDFLTAIEQVLPPGQILADEPMSRHTTFKIGGPADYLLLPASTGQLINILRAIKKYALPVTVLGNGSNVLVRDKGIRGVVIKFGEPWANLRAEGELLIAGAGALLKDAAQFAAQNSLSGLEFACGIPGSMGGATYMNAGAYEGEMKNIVAGVTAVSPTGEAVEYDRSQLSFAYRHSTFQQTGDIICEVKLKLQAGDKAAIAAKMQELDARRASKQPLDLASAGSTFKRPQGYFAGTLIDESGLKGLAVGGAQVSPKHAGFVVNTGTATAKDVIGLIAEVQKRVLAAKGVKLFPEVRIIGEE